MNTGDEYHFKALLSLQNVGILWRCSSGQGPLYACALHSGTQTDRQTHMHAYTRFMAQQCEGAQEGQAAPYLACCWASRV